MSRDSVASVPWYIPRRPRPFTTSIVVCRCSGGRSACIWQRIFTISIGFVAITWQRPAPAPAIISRCSGRLPSGSSSASLCMRGCVGAWGVCGMGVPR